MGPSNCENWKSQEIHDGCIEWAYEPDCDKVKHHQIHDPNPKDRKDPFKWPLYGSCQVQGFTEYSNQTVSKTANNMEGAFFKYGKEKGKLLQKPGKCTEKEFGTTCFQVWKKLPGGKKVDHHDKLTLADKIIKQKSHQYHVLLII